MPNPPPLTPQRPEFIVTTTNTFAGPEEVTRIRVADMISNVVCRAVRDGRYRVVLRDVFRGDDYDLGEWDLRAGQLLTILDIDRTALLSWGPPPPVFVTLPGRTRAPALRISIRENFGPAFAWLGVHRLSDGVELRPRIPVTRGTSLGTVWIAPGIPEQRARRVRIAFWDYATGDMEVTGVVTDDPLPPMLLAPYQPLMIDLIPRRTERASYAQTTKMIVDEASTVNTPADVSFGPGVLRGLTAVDGVITRSVELRTGFPRSVVTTYTAPPVRGSDIDLPRIPPRTPPPAPPLAPPAPPIRTDIVAVHQRRIRFAAKKK